VQQRSINFKTLQCCVPTCLLPWIVSHLTAVPYRTDILHWSLTYTFPLPPFPPCVHTAITVPEVVMCHFPYATPCCNVCLHFEVAVYSLYVPNQGCTHHSRSHLKIVGAREREMKQDPCCGTTISGCHCTKSGCQVPRTCASLS
jgi:hypothetical protein